MKIARAILVTLAAVIALGTLAASAYAVPGYSATCSACHGGSNITVTTSLVGNTGGRSTYAFDSPNADAVALFQGSTKLGTFGSSGQLSVANGPNYTLYAVRGPGTNSGLGSVSILPRDPAPDSGTPDDSFTTIGGANRYETAVAASKSGFPDTADAVVIATGSNWPDALGGGALAAAVGGPVLLTKPGSLPSSVEAEIERLGAGRAYILGGTGAVSADVERRLESLLGQANVERIGGRTRYETANLIARAVVNEIEDSGSFDGRIFVATGSDFPDALAATPLSAAGRRPIFLTGRNGLSTSTLDSIRAIGAHEAVILGGAGAVPDSVEASLRSQLGSSNVERLAGSNRYSTAVRIAEYGVDTMGLSWDGLALATGSDFPDALAGGVMQGLRGSVLLLTPSTSLHASINECITEHRAEITDLRLLGGSGALGDRVRSQLNSLLGSTPPAPDPDPDPGPAPDPGESPHATLSWADYPSNCLSCHPDEFGEAYQGLHYQWQGEAPENVNQNGELQGKLTNAINSYCVSIGGNWQICGKCHAGRGEMPVATDDPTTQQLLNVDCLVCHNDDYSAVRTRLTDGSLGPSTTDAATLDSYVRTISAPTRANCLSCHAYAGGGDAVKRGDLSWATASTTDRTYDVHMATTGADLQCQSCHEWSQHKVTGRGSDLRVTDNPGDMTCSTDACHPNNNAAGHPADIQRHVDRVACQTCHIPLYGRNAADTFATEATEIDRNWLDNDHVGGPKPWHPGTTKANDVMPEYEWWNGTSDAMLLGDQNLTPETDGTYATAKPLGTVSDARAKLYPFKYKTATQPMRSANSMLIGIDTLDYMTGSGDPDTAARLGMTRMGYAPTDAIDWVVTSTYQALNHSVAPAENALQCADCHGSTARLDLDGDLGYSLKGSIATVCTQCHGREDMPSFTRVHSEHDRYDCSWCHAFSRPERGRRTP